MAQYSICITHYNNASTVRRSIESLLTQINSDFEVVIVDNFSNDGSYEILKEYADSGAIKLLRAKSSRGKGRQIAFENSRGMYVISHLDMDDYFKPTLIDLLQEYHAKAEGKLLWTWSEVPGAFWGGESILIGPRQVIEKLGGWNDLQVFEDWELCRRAASQGVYCWGEFKLLDQSNPHPERVRSRFGTLRWKYIKSRESVRIGRPLQQFTKRHANWKQRAFETVIGPLVEAFQETYRNVPNLIWDKSDPECYVSLAQIGESRNST